MIVDNTRSSMEREIRESDIRDIQEQLAKVANDPNLTIITSHVWELSMSGLAKLVSAAEIEAWYG